LEAGTAIELNYLLDAFQALFTGVFSLDEEIYTGLKNQLEKLSDLKNWHVFFQ
jgi:hypothetical protein